MAIDIPDIAKLREVFVAFPNETVGIFVGGLVLGWGAAWMLAKRELKVNRSIVEAVKDPNLPQNKKIEILQHALPQKLAGPLLRSLGIIIGIALLASFLSWNVQEIIRTELRGGDSFPYVWAQMSRTDLDGIELWIRNDTKQPLSYLSAAVSLGDEYIGGRPFPVLPAGKQEMMGISVTPGDFKIEITAINGLYIEQLKITKGGDGKLRQTAIVRKDEKEILNQSGFVQ